MMHLLRLCEILENTLWKHNDEIIKQNEWLVFAMLISEFSKKYNQVEPKTLLLWNKATVLTTNETIIYMFHGFTLH